jgi:hypothetical protein
VVWENADPVIQKFLRISILFYGTIIFLVVGFLLSADARMISSLCKVKHPSDSDIEWDCKQIKKGETIERLFGDRWIEVLRFNRVDRRHLYPGIAIKVPKRLEDVDRFTPMPQFYERAVPEPKFILVDLSEQFLGAYEYGKLVFSIPVATGDGDNETPSGEFRVSAYDAKHTSSLYYIEKTDKLYPMHYGLRFHVNEQGVAFWIHGRDIPGFPASHGCIGLYDEEMQKQYYGNPKKPVLEDAKALFEWVISPVMDDGRMHLLKNGPLMSIIGDAPIIKSRPR